MTNETRPPLLLDRLPPWQQDELPAPLPFTPRNLLRTIGPGAILLAASIGGGEWLIGPAITVKHGAGILWIATVAIGLQLILNLEGIRFTLYTGEPIVVGIMRLKPGAGFWGVIYMIATFVQLGVPALAVGCGATIFAMIAGRLPGDGDVWTQRYIIYGVILGTVALLMSGKKIERVLEIASTFMVVFIFAFLIVVNVWFVPIEHSIETLGGFFQFGRISNLEHVDLVLLATFAATAGSGGIGNLTLTNWYRDKGMGMGAKVGAIHSAFSEEGGGLSATGKVFAINEENMSRWRNWWKYVKVDQVWLWAVGCFFGMYFNVNLATFVVEPGTDMASNAAGAIQAQAMAEKLWSGFWWLALLNGFWILYSTHLGNTDIMVRTVTDIAWVVSPRLRQRKGISVSKVYYVLLAVFTVWGLISVNFGSAIDLFKVLGTVAGGVLAVSAVQILIVNTRLLPPELRPPMWRRAALVLCAVGYGSLSLALIWDRFQEKPPAYAPESFREVITQLIAEGKYTLAVKYVDSADPARQTEHDGSGYLAVAGFAVLLPGVEDEATFDPDRDWEIPGTSDTLSEEDKLWQQAATRFAAEYNRIRAAEGE